MKKVITTEEEMQDFAIEIGKGLKGGEIIALEGDLGAGKTFFTQQLAKFLGVKDKVVSPTFVLMKKYDVAHSKLSIKYLVHVDAYRLEEPQELFYLGIEEHFNKPNTVVVVEWADKVEEYIKGFEKVIWIKIDMRDRKREISVT